MKRAGEILEGAGLEETATGFHAADAPPDELEGVPLEDEATALWRRAMIRRVDELAARAQANEQKLEAIADALRELRDG